MTTLLHRFTTNQDGLFHLYRADPNLRFAINQRECMQNGFGHDATRALLFSFARNKEYFFFFGHNGLPFDGDRHVESAFYPSTSIGSAGGNGSGGCMSPQLLVSRVSNYQHHIISKISPKKIISKKAVIATNRVVQIEEDPELVTILRKMMGGHFDEWTNAYVSRFDSNMDKKSHRNAVQTQAVASILMELAPHWLEAGKEVAIWDNLIVPEGGFLEEYEKTPRYSPKNIAIPSEVEKKCIHKEYEFTVSNIKQEDLGITVCYDATVTLKAFHGLFRQDAQTFRRDSLVGVNGEHAGKIITNCTHPGYNTSIKWGWNEDPSLSRVEVDPVFLGKMMETAGNILYACVVDRPVVYKDISDFPELNTAFKNYSYDVGNLLRKPYVTMEINITKINSVKEDEITIAKNDWRHDDIRRALGPINEMFLIQDRSRANQIVTNVLSALANNTHYSQKLEDFRKEMIRIFPQNDEDFGDLPTANAKREITYRWEPIPDQPADYQFPIDDLSRGRLLDESGDPVDADALFTCYGNGLNRLQHISGDQWSMYICGFHREMPDGTYKKCSLEEYMAAPLYTTLPERKVRFIRDGNVILIDVAAGVPKKKTAPSNPKAKTKTLNKREGRSTHMFSSLSPISCRVRYEAGQLKLNRDHPDNKIAFNPSVPQKTRDAFFMQIGDACHRYEMKIKQVVNAGEFLSKDIDQVWDSNTHHYLCNQFIDVTYELVKKSSWWKASEKKLGIINKFASEEEAVPYSSEDHGLSD